MKATKQSIYARERNYNDLIRNQMLDQIEKERGEEMNASQKEHDSDWLKAYLPGCDLPAISEIRNAFAKVLGYDNWKDLIIEDETVLEIVTIAFDKAGEKEYYDVLHSGNIVTDKRYLPYYVQNCLFCYISSDDLKKTSYIQYQELITKLNSDLIEYFENNKPYLWYLKQRLQECDRYQTKPLVRVVMETITYLKEKYDDFY